MVFGPKKICRTAKAAPATRRPARITAAMVVNLLRGIRRIREVAEVAEVIVLPRSVRPTYSQGTAERRYTAAGPTTAVPATGSPDRARCRRGGIPRGSRGRAGRFAGQGSSGRTPNRHTY